MSKRLLRTTAEGKGRGSHYHVAFIDEESGQGLVAESSNHAHELQFVPPTAEATDEFGNLLPANPGGWQLSPGGEDGHTHGLEEYEPDYQTESEDDDKIVKEVHQLFRAARELEKESFERAEECERFYCGEQWEEGQKRELEELSRAALTINKIEKGVDVLTGHQRQQRTDIRYLPMEGGDQRVADLLNILTKQITEQTGFEREESEVFEDAVIVGRGIFNLWVDFSRDLQGEIKIERFPWGQVRFGPHEKRDLSDCEYILKDKMYSLPKLKQLYREKAKDLQRDFEDYEDPATGRMQYAGDDYRVTSDNWKPFFVGDVKLADIAKKEFRLIECVRKVYIPSAVVVAPEQDFYFTASGWKEKDLTAIKTLPGFDVFKRDEQRLRITRVCGRTVLYDENPADVPVNDFLIVPVYAKKRRGRFWGKVLGAIDPQREVNKRHSQSIDIANKMAVYGYGYDEGTFADSIEKERFKKTGNSPGFMVQLNDVNRPPIKFEGSKFPSELVNLMQLSSNNLDELMNIVVEPSGANESGAHMLQMQRLRLVGNEFLFDALSFAKKQVGRLLVALIQRFYSPERIYRIVSNQNTKTPVQVGGQPLSEFSEEEITSLLRESDLTKFDVIVSESNYSPSWRLGVATLLMELAQAGIQIPPQAIVKFVDMPESERAEIFNAITLQQQQAAAAEGDKQKAEVTKTLIAQGIIPPEVQQQLGVGGAVPQQNQGAMPAMGVAG